MDFTVKTERVNNEMANLNTDVIKKIETFIKCPRCKQHLKYLRRKVLTPNKLKSVCDHCMNEYLLHRINKLPKEKKITAKESVSKKYSKHKVKLLLSNVKELMERKNVLLKAVNFNKKLNRSLKLLSQTKPETLQKTNNVSHEVEVDQMFKALERTELLYREKSDETKGRELEIKNIDFLENSRKDISYEKETVLNNNNIVTQHSNESEITIPSLDSDSHSGLDLLRQKMSKQRYKSPDKISSLKIFNHDGSKFNQTQNKLTDTNRTSRLKNRDKVDHDLVYDKSLFEKRKSTSVQHLKSQSVGNLTLADNKSIDNFSYFFPKEDRIRRPIRRHKSSAELISEVMEMLNTRAAAERVKKEKYEQKRNGKPDEVIPDADLNKADNIEKKEYITEDINKTTDDIEPESKRKVLKSKNNSEKILQKDYPKREKYGNDNLKQEKNLKNFNENDNSLKTNEKGINDIMKGKEKLENEERLKLEKEMKLKQKAEQEERLRSEKEKKMKEKTEKEQRLKLEMENKLREKAEKEERLRSEQQRKLMEKEEKVRREQEKREQMLKNKNERKKEKSDQNVEKEKIKNEKHSKAEPTFKPDTSKLLAEHTKDEVKFKKQQEEDHKRMGELADKKLKEEAFAEITVIKQDKNKKSGGNERVKKIDSSTKQSKNKTEPTTKELNISKIKLRRPSPDDLILRLVRIKKTEEPKRKSKPTCLKDLNVSPVALKVHEGHKYRNVMNCMICKDSDLEIDIDNILYKGKDKLKEPKNVIVGEKIIKNSGPLTEKTMLDKDFEPLLFKSTFQEQQPIPVLEVEKQTKREISVIPNKHTEQEPPKGVIRYALSDRTFIDKGWTMLPTEKVVRKMNVYRMRPAHPEFDWFEHNKNKKLMTYDTGEKLAEFDDSGKGCWYYRNGRKALDYYDAEETNAQQRFVIYSNGEPDERGRARPFTVLATFDYLGNGVVFDHSGKIRLKYNQTEGVVLDRSIGPASHWKWHTLNDPPVLQQVMIDTQVAHKDPDILKLGGPGDDKSRHDNEDMLAIEFDNFIKEKSKKLSQKFKPFQIKMKALKINENFSLKVLDQATVYLIFRDGSTNLKLNIGMILDHKEIVDTDTAEVGVVSNSLERYPARTDSLAGLQRSIAHAQRVERSRIERERRLRPTQSCASADKLTAGTCKPLRHPIHTVSSTLQECRCICRKPYTKNIYYDTRLI